MPITYADVLAGPIVRRVDRRTAAVWIALAKPAQVTLKLWEGPQEGDTVASPLATGAAVATRRMGAALHLALAVITRRDESAQHFKSDQLYSYDVELKQEGESLSKGLLKLGFLGLAEDGGAGEKAALPLGYKDKRLPSFALPPTDIGKLNLLAGSCRLPYSPAPDAMAAMDDLLKDGDTHADALKRPHQLFLTGDQIYADELSPYQLELVNRVGNRLLSGSDAAVGEHLPVLHEGTAYEVPLDCTFFPPARRQRLIRTAGLTTASGDSHALGFGEFAALYLLAWSDRLWPADFFTNALAAQNAAGGYAFLTHDLEDKVLKDHVFASDRARELAYHKLYHFHAWRLLKPQWRVLDRSNFNGQVLDEWGDDPELAGLPLDFPPLTTEDTDSLPDLPEGVPNAVLPTLSRRLTPSWFAGERELGFARVNGAKFYLDKGLVELRALQEHVAGLAKVRRLLANVPTYMTFDDHEVTDDWNISREWVTKVNADPLGRAVLRHGLLAYGLFQGWGNDPAYFQGTEATPGSRLLDEASRLFPPAPADPGDSAARAQAAAQRTAAIAALDRLLNLGAGNTPDAERVRWHYRVGGPGYEVLSLDSRTMRGYKSDDGPPEILSRAAIERQIPAEPEYSYGTPAGGKGITFVIAAAPVLGFPPVEYLVQPVVNSVDRLARPPAKERGTYPVFVKAHTDYWTGAVEHDPEPWAYHEDIVEALLARLAKHRRVIFLSGDVHYASASRLDYWRFPANGAPESTRFLQVTASALKNYAGDAKASLFRHGVASQLSGVLALPRERLAWSEPDGAPITAPAGVKFSNLVRRRLREDPVMVPVAALPPGTRQEKTPTWAWRMDLLKDERPDGERFAGVAVPEFQAEVGSAKTTFFTKLATRHFWQTVHGGSRVVSFSSNFGRITVDTSKPGEPRLVFALHQQLRELPQAGTRPFLAYTAALDATGEEPPAVPSDVPAAAAAEA